MNFAFLTGLLLTLGLIIGVSLSSARKSKDATSFTTAGSQVNSLMVTGIIMTSLVGGQSTVGTAQLAFSYGISAWWFTIGAALGCLLLAAGYGKALRNSGCDTLLMVVGKEYGPHSEKTGSLLCFIGIFISIVAQLLSSSALMTGLLHINMIWGAAISAALMMLMVVIGGVWSAGYSGMLKAVLLCLATLGTGILVLVLCGGYGGLQSLLTQQTTALPLGDQLQLHSAEDVHLRFGNLTARGFMKDVGGGLSLILGVVTTQTYAQGIWAARSNSAAKRGAVTCAVITPLIGAGCVLAGIYMRAHYVTIDEAHAITAAGASLPQGIGVLRNTAEAFPVFVMDRFPPMLAGIIIGTMLLTIIGGGSGLALGAATILVRDVYGNVRNRLMALRLTISAILLAGFLFSLTGGHAFINDLGFLSLGLRATAVLIPLTAALYFPGAIQPRHAWLSMIAGTVMLLVAHLANLPGGPIWWGLAAGILVILPGVRRLHAAGN